MLAACDITTKNASLAPGQDAPAAEVTGTTIAPTYPVIQYGHVPGGGDAIGSGFLYTGTAIPMLRGKYVFTDISTGHLWYADYQEMLAADDGDPRTMAERHDITISWEGRTFDTMFPIAKAAYHARGGKSPILPGRSLVSGEGRADANLAADAAGRRAAETPSLAVAVAHSCESCSPTEQHSLSLSNTYI